MLENNLEREIKDREIVKKNRVYRSTDRIRKILSDVKISIFQTLKVTMLGSY